MTCMATEEMHFYFSIDGQHNKNTCAALYAPTTGVFFIAGMTTIDLHKA